MKTLTRSHAATDMFLQPKPDGGPTVTGGLTGTTATGILTGRLIKGIITGPTAVGGLTGPTATGGLTGPTATGGLTGTTATGGLTGTTATGGLTGTTVVGGGARAGLATALARSHAATDMFLQLTLGARDLVCSTRTGAAEAALGEALIIHVTIMAVRTVTFRVYISILWTIVASSGKQTSPE